MDVSGFKNENGCACEADPLDGQVGWAEYVDGQTILVKCEGPKKLSPLSFGASSYEVSNQAMLK